MTDDRNVDDPNLDDRNLDDRVRRLVHDAVADAPDPHWSPRDLDAPASTPPSRRGRWVSVGALAAALVATVTGLVFVGRDRDTGVQPIDDSPVPASSTSSTGPPPTSTVTEVSTPAVETDATDPPTDDSHVVATGSVEIVRPVAAAEQCTTVAARDGYIKPLSYIGRASANPVPLALFADPTASSDPAFVVLHRFFDDRSVRGDDLIDVGDTTYGIAESTDGDLEITWRLDDSLGLARARGFTRDELIDFVAALEPRPADAIIAGFEYQPTAASASLRLVQEINHSDVVGTVARSVCVADAGNRYRVTALNGDPVFVYSAMLDRPAPLDVVMVDDAAVVINGPAGRGAPRAGDVVDTDISEWQRLLAQPEDETHAATVAGAASGTDTTVELVSVDGTVEPSELTVRITTTDGVSSLEVDKRGSVLHPDAAYWVIEVDGRIRGASSAYPGGLSGQTLGDLAGRTEPVVARVSIVDGGDFVLQTTGNIELPLP